MTFLDQFQTLWPHNTNVEKQDRKLDGLHLFSLLSRIARGTTTIVTEIEWIGKLEDAEMRMQ